MTSKTHVSDTTTRSRSCSSLLMTVATVAMLAGFAFAAVVTGAANAGWLGTPQYTTAVQGQPTALPLPPTLAPAQRQVYAQQAPATAAEQQVVATPAPIAPPAADVAYVPLNLSAEEQALNNLQGPAPTMTPKEIEVLRDKLAAPATDAEQNLLNSIESTQK